MNTVGHMHERCEELSSPSILNFVLSCLILLGIVASYLPQHVRIIRRRSSEGLSPYFILLGTVSGSCAAANILILPTSRSDMRCCSQNSAFACIAGLLGIAQVLMQWGCFFLIMLLFVIFMPGLGRRNSIRDADSNEVSPPWREAVIVVATSITHVLITALITIIISARAPQHLQTWANVLGILCAVLAVIQYFPQIGTTLRLQRVGSLSIPMMCIQTPGSFVWAGSLAARFGKQGWSTWAVYLVTGVLQGSLLVMAITFELRDQRARAKERALRRSLSGHPTNNAQGDESSLDPGNFADSNSSRESDPLLDDARARGTRSPHSASDQSNRRTLTNSESSRETFVSAQEGRKQIDDRRDYGSLRSNAK